MTIANRIAGRIVGSLTAPLVALLIAAGPVQAAPLSYILDQSNDLDDGIGYIQVTVDNGVDGAIDFTVTPLPSLLALATDKFEIRAFAFNVAEGVDATGDNVVGLPDHYNARQTSRMDGFGRFDLTIFGTGPAHITSLAFSIVGVDGDTPESYVDLSQRNANEGNVFFAARVRGLDHDPDAFVGGPGGAEVPLPATAWLLLTGFVGVFARARRRRRLLA